MEKNGGSRAGRLYASAPRRLSLASGGGGVIDTIESAMHNAKQAVEQFAKFVTSGKLGLEEGVPV